MTSQWRCIHTITLPADKSPAIRFSPDGKTLFVDSQMWDVNTGELKKTETENKQGILSLDGKTLVACDSDGQTLQLWDVETGALTKSFTPNSSRITLTVLSHDSQTLVTNDAEQNLKLWNVSTGEVTYNLGQFAFARSVFFSPNGQILALHLSNKAYFWDVHTGERLGNLDNKTVNSIAFTSDSKALLIVRRTETQRTEVSSAGGSDWYENTYYYPEIWDGISGQIIGSFAGEFVGLSSDGQIAIGKHRSYSSREVSKSISFRSFNGSQTINPISGGTDAAFSLLGNILGVVEEDGQSLKLLKWPSGQEIATIPGYIRSFAFGPDEMTLATVSSNSIKLWQNSTKPLVEQRLHGNAHPHLQKLEDLLAAERWEDADKETAAIIKSFPSQDLNPIDQLWVHYSKGHYGFSVQKKIWELNKLNNNPSKVYENFELSVGWGTMETDHMYHGDNDQYVATAWKKTSKGYYPRECYGAGFHPSSELWSRLKG